jgi:hypothetical protein
MVNLIHQNRQINHLQLFNIGGGNSAFKQSFLDTGIRALIGDVIRVVVHPSVRWRNGSGQEVNANGQDDNGASSQLSAPYPSDKGERNKYFIKADNLSFPDGAIVGTWDNGETFIPIGQYCEFCVTSDLDLWQPAKDSTFKLAVWGNGASDTKSNAPQGNLAIFHGEGTQRYSQVHYNNPDFWIDSADYNRPRQGGAFLIDAQVHNINNGSDDNGKRILKQTGIQCKVGDIITIVIDFQDDWNIMDNYPTHPCGYLKSHGGAYHRHSFRNDIRVNHFSHGCGAVVGTFDTGDWKQRSYFPVGHYLKMTVLKDGELTLMHWDCDYGNNSGILTAYVTTNHYNGFKGFHNGNQSLDLRSWGWDGTFFHPVGHPKEGNKGHWKNGNWVTD